jgi:polysaccharide export outer membrane protein
MNLPELVKTKRQVLLLFSLLMICVAAAAQAQPQNANAKDTNANSTANTNAPAWSKPPVLGERFPRYQVRPGDVLNLDFRFQPEYNQAITVQPDGFISLKDVGDIQVNGRTVPDINAEIVKKYSTILKDPVLTTTLKDFEHPYFVVGGEVNRPGKFEMRGDVTVTEALQIAGGMNDRSKHSQVLLFRQVSSEWTSVKKLDVKRMMAKADLQEDIHLQPGDMIFVPQNRISKIKSLIPSSSVGASFRPTGN